MSVSAHTLWIGPLARMMSPQASDDDFVMWCDAMGFASLNPSYRTLQLLAFCLSSPVGWVERSEAHHMR